MSGQNASYTDIECDTSAKCKHNTDNQIFHPYKEFTYLFTTTVKPENFNVHTGLDDLTSPITLTLKIMPDCFFDQTMVVYEYLRHDTIFNHEITGLIDNEKHVWVHPPRSLIESIEYSPYFEYKYRRTQWRNALFVTNTKLKNSTKNFIWATHRYSVVADTTVVFNNDTLQCKIVHITSRYRKRKFHSIMLFNHQLGFIWMDMHLINDERYRMELLKIKSDFCGEKNTIL